MKYVIEKINKRYRAKYLQKLGALIWLLQWPQMKTGKDRDMDEVVIGVQATAAWGYGVAAARSYSDWMISSGSYHKTFTKGLFDQQNEEAYVKKNNRLISYLFILVL